MFRSLNFLLQNLYKAIMPGCIQKRLTPTLIRVWLCMSAVVSHRKKKRLDYVEVRITDHCNLNCRSCAQLSPLAEPVYIETVVFTNDFQRLHAITGGDIKTIRLMGGEPLLHPRLVELMRIVRDIFGGSRIVLVTNGILLSKQDDDFWNTCRDKNIEILISHYPVKIDYESLLTVSKKHKVKLRYATKKPQVMCKWTFDVYGKQDAKKNFYKCYFGNNCIQIDNGRLYNCSLIPCVKYFNNRFGKDMRVAPEDFIDIYKEGEIKRILEFLARPVPFCRYCNLDKVSYGERWEPSKREMGEWT